MGDKIAVSVRDCVRRTQRANSAVDHLLIRTAFINTLLQRLPPYCWRIDFSLCASSSKRIHRLSLCYFRTLSVRLSSMSMESKSRLRRAAIYIAGWFFILLGILGLVLPILQGILFILVGLFLLSSVSPRAERLLHRIRERFPRISKTFDEAKSRAKHTQARIAARAHSATMKARYVHAQIFRRKHDNPEDLK